jgi:hypothetical protein
MSILIKGIEMPKSCIDCPCSLNMFFCRARDGRAITDRTGIEFKEDGIVVSRPDWCPLEEVPGKHGRLIDADELEIILESAINIMKAVASIPEITDDLEVQMEIKAYTDILDGVLEQPTIIGAERNGED